jgi:uncharacterized protein YuzE
VTQQRIDSSMSEPGKTQMNYFGKDDVLHIVISEEKEAGSVELSPSITAELNEKGELIGIEILNASNYLRDSILEGVQAKLLNLRAAPPEPAGT